MKQPKFLCLPTSHRRNRSKTRSEVGPIEGQSKVDSATSCPTESTPDLRVGTPTLPDPSLLALRDWKSIGMQTILFRLIHLSPLFCTTQTPTPTPIESCLSPEETGAPSRSPRVALSMQKRLPRTNRIGSPLCTPQLS